jgi:ubiquitin carboxyl-terminal hydrolase 34
MILKAPANSIEAPAVNMLVDLYVESTMISSMPRARAHSIHLALVARCLNQLSSAAIRLKGFTDGNTSGEEEPMIIVASEDQIHEQELAFTRSLMILREFLRSYQSKPHYVMPKPRSPILNVSNEIQGELFNIKYQAFDGLKSGDVSELSIGKQNTVATLFSIIQKTTGFKGCKIYHWGKEIDATEADAHGTLEGLKIGRGLLLVLRSDDDNVASQSRSRSSTLELEIIKHFDELWDYLGMEEKLAREVCIHFSLMALQTDLLFPDQISCLWQALSCNSRWNDFLHGCIYSGKALQVLVCDLCHKGTLGSSITTGKHRCLFHKSGLLTVCRASEMTLAYPGPSV